MCFGAASKNFWKGFIASREDKMGPFYRALASSVACFTHTRTGRNCGEQSSVMQVVWWDLLLPMRNNSRIKLRQMWDCIEMQLKSDVSELYEAIYFLYSVQITDKLRDTGFSKRSWYCLVIQLILTFFMLWNAKVYHKNQPFSPIMD